MVVFLFVVRVELAKWVLVTLVAAVVFVGDDKRCHNVVAEVFNVGLCGTGGCRSISKKWIVVIGTGTTVLPCSVCICWCRRTTGYTLGMGYVPGNGLRRGRMCGVGGGNGVSRTGRLRCRRPIAPWNAVGLVRGDIDEVTHIVDGVLSGVGNPVQFPTRVAPSFCIDGFAPTLCLRGQETHERLFDDDHGRA